MTNSKIAKFDPVTLEILWSRLISIADESAAALLRTSFSTNVRESNDFATVLMDANGDSLAENTAGIPSFVGMLPDALKNFVKRIPIEEWRNSFKGELERLLYRSYHSPLARPWLTDSDARTEKPFTLVLNYGLVHGKIDYIGRATDGCWQLVNYKTGPIADRNQAAHRYRLQMEI